MEGLEGLDSVGPRSNDFVRLVWQEDPVDILDIPITVRTIQVWSPVKVVGVGSRRRRGKRLGDQSYREMRR